ncbi:hypothetical protein DYB36_003017 [Aphanomyces astaci]|uniref:NAD(P)H-hydrate epimerase n=1 Tax=Aphanomyces astaci TaxID=112090 RepID=A0A397A5R3_APHAT|nr:hypothetical protein DYB36_003017 [Aphanomyces astaci]
MRRPQLRFLSQAQAQRIDEELMSTYAFSIDQLMELAGLSVACVVENEFGHVAATPLLVVAGPGNNGYSSLPFKTALTVDVEETPSLQHVI